MKCPACQFENPDGMKFCGQCGKPFAPTCPNCGAEVPAGMAFCGQCGTRIAGEAPQAASATQVTSAPQAAPATETMVKPAAAITRRDELKTVTVLFSDIKGSTTMGERLPPDEVKDIMNDCLSLMEAEILKRDGTVDKYLGDGIMALFGAPISHEDDPERAVHAALAIQEKVKEYARKVEKRAGTLLEVRVGINTGKVLAGHIGKEKADYTVMGDAVNLASRMESMATPGRVQISHNTYRHIKRRFNFDAKGALKVKGLAREVKAYEVIGTKEDESQAFSFEVAGVRPKMAGRDMEMGILRETMEQVTVEKIPKLVTIFGARGVGKSRLVYEFLNYIMGLSRAAIISSARCVGAAPHSYWLISELIKGWIGTRGQEATEVFHEKFLTAVRRLIPDERSATETAHFIGNLIGMPFPDSPHTKPYESDPKMAQQVAFKCLSTLFSRAGARQPVMLIAEDIHDADTGSLEALLYLSMTVENAGLLIIATAREEQLEAKDLFARDLPNLTTMRLQALGKKACATLLADMFSKVENVSDQYRDMIVEKSEGNPYYVEEIVKDLIDRNVITSTETEDGKKQWEMTQEGEDLGVPQTLEGLVQTRVDRLPGNEKILLQEAASVGDDFWENTLKNIEIASDPATFQGSPRPISERLSALDQKDFTFRKPISRFTNETQYSFKHSFMREVVYGSIPSKIRRRFHSVIAKWLTEKSKDSAEQYHALLAYHYERADEAEKACEEYRAAGRTSKQLHDSKEAMAIYKKVLELADGDTEAVKEAQEALGDLYLVTGDFEASEKAYEEFLNLCAEEKEKARACVCMGRLDESRGQYGEAMEHYSQAEDQLAGIPDSDSAGIRIDILRGMTGVLMRRGENDEALEFANSALEALSEYESSVENTEAPAAILNTMGLTYQQKGEMDTAMESFEMALEEYREIGNKRGESMVLNNMGIIHFSRGDLAAAEPLYARSRDISHDVGDIQGRANAITNIGLIHQAEYRYQTAVEDLTAALEIRRRMGDRGGVANSLINIAIIYLSLGHTPKAEEVLDEIDQLCEVEDNMTWQWYGAFCRGELCRLGTDLQSAMNSFEKARELAQTMKNPTMEGWVLQSIAEVFLDMKDYDKTSETASEARVIFEQAGDEKASLGIRLYEIEALLGKDAMDTIEADLNACKPAAEKFMADRDLISRYNDLLGRFSEKKGDAAQARTHYQEAFRLKETIVSELTDPELKKSYMERPEVKELSETLKRLG